MSTRPKFGSRIGARMHVNGKMVNYFCGTSYYCMHSNPEVMAAASQAIESYGLGVGTNADMEIYDELKNRAAEFFGVEEITYFASGYLSISVLLKGLRNEFDFVLVDAASHYCVFDAIRELGKPIFTFKHLDDHDLSQMLAKHATSSRTPAIVTDGVFPSTGIIAPLDRYADVMKAYPGALLCIDDSHGVGVLGPNGRGSFDHFGLSGPQYYQAGTLSKAFGGYGGFVGGTAALAEKIRTNAKLMVGASPPPIPAAAAACAGLKVLSQSPEIRQNLWQNVKYLRQSLADIGIQTPQTNVPIVSFGADENLAEVAQELERRGTLVRQVPPLGYSDAPDQETLRVAVFSTHSRSQIDEFISGLKELLPKASSVSAGQRP
jgi:8-amino-7-oxononanoate synthase